MDTQFRALRTLIISVVTLVAGAFVLNACGGPEESSADGDRSTSDEQSSVGAEVADGDAPDVATEPEGPSADDEDEVGGEEVEVSADDDESVEVFLSSVESAVQPLGEVIGVTRPAGLEPVTIRVDSYPRLCPADDVPIEAIRQEDPLLENLPVVRYIVAFSDPEEASTFFDELASTEVGCVDERVSEVANATATITEVVSLEALGGPEAVQVGASIAVDMVNLDRDPPGSDVIRSVAVEGSAVIIVVSIANYGSVIGVADVHGPLLTDGVELVRAAG